jgi:superfamily II DNA or RNA helicase
MHVEIVIWNKWCFLNAPGNIKNDISAFLSYKVPNARFTYSGEEYKTLLTKKGAFKTGFLSSVVQRLSDIGCEVIKRDQRNNKFEILPGEVVHELPTGNLRDRQESALDVIFSDSNDLRGIVDAATNFGKNWVIAAATKTVLPKSKVLITIHRQELFVQLYEFLTECGIEVSRYGTYGNKRYTEIGHVTLAMYKTLGVDMQKTEVLAHLKSVGTLLVDEAHRATSKEYYEVLSNVDAYSVFYFSGTPFTGVDQHDLNMVGDSGEVKVKITNQDLIDDGVSQKPLVTFKTITQSSMPIFTYQDELLELMYSQERLNYMKSIINESLDSNTLISVRTKDHGEYLLVELSKLATVVEFVQSNDPERASKVKSFKDGITKVLITTEILKEGVNLPLIHNYINAAEGKSVVWLKQFLGRALRHDGINETVNVYDFIDMGRYTKAHSDERLRIYTAEGFDIKII